MNYKIVYDKPGRIRLTYGTGSVFRPAGYGIESLLMSGSEVLSAEASHVNGGILICYEPGYRDNVLAVIDGLNKRCLSVLQKQDINQVRELDDAFLRSMAAFY